MALNYIFALAFVAISIVTGNIQLLLRFFGVFLLLSIQVMALYYRWFAPWQLERITDHLTMLLFCVSVISLFHVQELPYLIRSIDWLYPEYRLRGVGGYELVYALVLLIPVVVYRLKFRRKGWAHSLYNLAFVGAGSALVISAGFALATAVLMGAVILVLLGPHLSIRVVLRGLVVLLVIVFASSRLLPVIVNLTRGTPYGDTVLALAQFGQENLGAPVGVDGRTLAYTLSLNTFLAHPIGGYVFAERIQLGDFASLHDSVRLGQHSLFLDVLAAYGFFMGALMGYLIFWLPFKLAIINKPILTVTASTIVSLLGVTFLNNDVPAMGFVVYFALSSIYFHPNVSVKSPPPCQKVR